MNVLRLRSELGERIRVLGARRITDLEGDAEVSEVVILGDSVMYAVIYDADRKGAGARRFTDGGDCVEVSDDFPGVVPVRDSKRPERSAVIFGASAWSAFVDGVRA